MDVLPPGAKLASGQTMLIFLVMELVLAIVEMEKSSREFSER